MRIGLVACAKTKLARPAPARALYTSVLFRKASAYCERTYDRWFVLSAQWGLVAPERVLAPYDLTLRELSPEARLDWAASIVGGLSDAGLTGEVLCLHAGGHYRRALERYVALFHDEAGVPAPRPRLRFEAPLAGLGIGRQLAWYTARGY